MIKISLGALLGERRKSFGVALGALSLGLFVTGANARPVPQNLAGGLGTLVESNMAVKQNSTAAIYNGYATPEAANYADLAIQDTATKRFLVDIHPSGRASFDETLNALKTKFASLTVTAVDKKYKGVGVIEGYISLDDVPALGNMREVRSVNL